jgi:hypothetical protein
VSLAPLDDGDTARLLAALLDRSVLPAEQQQELLARAGGNPLYAEQFARMFAERGESARGSAGDCPGDHHGTTRLARRRTRKSCCSTLPCSARRSGGRARRRRRRAATPRRVQRKEFIRRERQQRGRARERVLVRAPAHP